MFFSSRSWGSDSSCIGGDRRHCFGGGGGVTLADEAISMIHARDVAFHAEGLLKFWCTKLTAVRGRGRRPCNLDILKINLNCFIIISRFTAVC